MWLAQADARSTSSTRTLMRSSARPRSAGRPDTPPADQTLKPGRLLSHVAGSDWVTGGESGALRRRAETVMADSVSGSAAWLPSRVKAALAAQVRRCSFMVVLDVDGDGRTLRMAALAQDRAGCARERGGRVTAARRW